MSIKYQTIKKLHDAANTVAEHDGCIVQVATDGIADRGFGYGVESFCAVEGEESDVLYALFLALRASSAKMNMSLKDIVDILLKLVEIESSQERDSLEAH